MKYVYGQCSDGDSAPFIAKIQDEYVHHYWIFFQDGWEEYCREAPLDNFIYDSLETISKDEAEQIIFLEKL
jgi:hypothetical protein